METKDFALTVKAVEETGTFEGYAAIAGNVDSYGDVVQPGAFGESLAKHRREGTKPLLLWQHNPDEPIGVWEDMAEDGKGLWGKGRLLTAVRRGLEAYELLKAGALRGLSIGYRVLKSEPDGNKRKLVSVDVLEASLVSFPANTRAKVLSVKSERMEEFARRLRDGDPMPTKDFEDILREAGVPKAMAVQIASVGYVKAIRRESEGKANEAVVRALREATRAFIPSLKKDSLQ